MSDVHEFKMELKPADDAGPLRLVMNVAVGRKDFTADLALNPEDLTREGFCDTLTHAVRLAERAVRDV